MNSLLSCAFELQHVAHELMYLGMDGEPIYSDTFCRLNKEVLVKSNSLFSSKSSDIEEEANLCLALLMGYNATIYDYGDKEQKNQEAHSIMDQWDKGTLTSEQAEVMEELKNIEENQYPFEILQ